MSGAIIYPEIIGALADSGFLVVPAIKEDMARYAARRALGEEVRCRMDWNLVVMRSIESCMITLEILWDDGNITVIGFPTRTWEQLGQFMHYSNLLLLPHRGLIGADNNMISPVAAQEGFLIEGLQQGLKHLANKAANIPPELNVRGLMTYLSDLLNSTRKTNSGIFLS